MGVNTQSSIRTDGVGENDFELQFVSLTARGPTYAFPCDALGHVDMDRLSARARLDYLYARALVGRDVERPAVVPCHGG